jgi:hypothetical protein
VKSIELRRALYKLSGYDNDGYKLDEIEESRRAVCQHLGVIQVLLLRHSGLHSAPSLKTDKNLCFGQSQEDIHLC